MKNALILALATAGAYLVGRAAKSKPLTCTITSTLRGAELADMITAHNYRRTRTA